MKWYLYDTQEDLTTVANQASLKVLKELHGISKFMYMNVLIVETTSVSHAAPTKTRKQPRRCTLHYVMFLVKVKETTLPHRLLPEMLRPVNLPLTRSPSLQPGRDTGRLNASLMLFILTAITPGTILVHRPAIAYSCSTHQKSQSR